MGAHSDSAPKDGAPTRGAPTVGDVVGAFKSLTTNGYIRGINDTAWLPFDGRLWQRNYHEHIIRNEEAYSNIAEYTRTNPQKWQDDIYCNARVQGGAEAWRMKNKISNGKKIGAMNTLNLETSVGRQKAVQAIGVISES